MNIQLDSADKRALIRTMLFITVFCVASCILAAILGLAVRIFLSTSGLG